MRRPSMATQESTTEQGRLSDSNEKKVAQPSPAGRKLMREQQDIKDELDQFLKDNEEVLERHRRLLRLANLVLNKNGESPGPYVLQRAAAAADSVSNPWGTCCTISGCKTDTQSHCADIGGSFTAFPSGS